MSPLGAVVVRRVVVVLEVDDCAAGDWAQVAPVRTKAISRAKNVFMVSLLAARNQLDAASGTRDAG